MLDGHRQQVSNARPILPARPTKSVSPLVALIRGGVLTQCDHRRHRGVGSVQRQSSFLTADALENVN